MNKLVGLWEIAEGQNEVLQTLGDIRLEFKENGELLYAVREGDKVQVSVLSYKIDGSDIITDQASAPSVERTPFSISEATLNLEFDGIYCRLKRSN